MYNMCFRNFIFAMGDILISLICLLQVFLQKTLDFSVTECVFGYQHISGTIVYIVSDSTIQLPVIMI